MNQLEKLRMWLKVESGVMVAIGTIVLMENLLASNERGAVAGFLALAIGFAGLIASRRTPESPA